MIARSFMMAIKAAKRVQEEALSLEPETKKKWCGAVACRKMLEDFFSVEVHCVGQENSLCFSHK